MFLVVLVISKKKITANSETKLFQKYSIFRQFPFSQLNIFFFPQFIAKMCDCKSKIKCFRDLVTLRLLASTAKIMKLFTSIAVLIKIYS